MTRDEAHTWNDAREMHYLLFTDSTCFMVSYVVSYSGREITVSSKCADTVIGKGTIDTECSCVMMARYENKGYDVYGASCSIHENCACEAWRACRASPYALCLA